MDLEDAMNLIDDLLTKKSEEPLQVISQKIENIVINCLNRDVNPGSDISENLVLVCGLLSVCIKYQIQDSQIIKQVLLLAWHSSHNFAVIFSRKSLREIYWNPQHLKWDKSFLFDFEDEVVQTFFLRHSWNTKLLINDNRIVDVLHCRATTPIIDVISQHDIIAVKMLVKFGCELNLENSHILEVNNRRLSRASRGVKFFNIVKLDVLSRQVRGILLTLRLLYSKDRCFRKIYESIPEGYKKFDSISEKVEILKILLRAVPKIGRNIFCVSKLVAEATLPRLYLEDETIPDEDYYDTSYIYSLSSKIPCLPERTLMPANLKHLCRCKIRDTLNKYWNLPSGIHELSLPKHLRQYLDLEYD